jgi:hypothetical protein
VLILSHSHLKFLYAVSIYQKVHLHSFHPLPRYIFPVMIASCKISPLYHGSNCILRMNVVYYSLALIYSLVKSKYVSDVYKIMRFLRLKRHLNGFNDLQETHFELIVK